MASGGSLLNTAAIKNEICEYVPGTILFPYGYLPIWSSIGGNVLVYGLYNAAFSWVDHCSFVDEETITLPKTYEMISFSQHGIMEALIPVSTDPVETFLMDLQQDRYEAMLDELD